MKGITIFAVRLLLHFFAVESVTYVLTQMLGDNLPLPLFIIIRDLLSERPSAMKLRSFALVWTVLLPAVILSTVTFGQTPADPHKPVLDRLDSLMRKAEPEWRFHSDIPHPEDPGLDDSGWGVLTVKNVS